MQPHIHLVTLGVADLKRATAFYRDGLGWPLSPRSQEGVSFFQLGGLVLSLYSRHALAEDAGLPDDAPEGGAEAGRAPRFSGIALAYNARSEAEVDAILGKVAALGARITRPAAKTSWGGYSGYFADLDGHAWEVAHNPFFPFDEKGILQID